jgi:hypothetical protein
MQVHHALVSKKQKSSQQYSSVSKKHTGRRKAQYTSSDKTSLVFIAVSQKSGTPLADKWCKYKSDIQNGNLCRS